MQTGKPCEAYSAATPTVNHRLRFPPPYGKRASFPASISPLTPTTLSPEEVPAYRRQAEFIPVRGHPP
ncbi:MAG: hypothetical protein ACE1Z1_00580, partial [Candidatus Acidiferrales bacterium]